MMRCLATALVLVLITTTAVAREPKVDPSTGRIRILYAGDAWGPTPYFYMTAEPSFIGTPIPATYAHIGTYADRQLKQFMRIYMPRNYDDFIAHYDLLILSDTNRVLYTLEQLNWFGRGVEQEGMGMMMVGGIEAFGGDSYPTWADSPVEDALPVLCVTGQTFRKDFRVIVRSEGSDFISSLPWSTMPFFHGMNVVTAKEGSVVLLSASLEPNDPVLVYWEYGSGSGLAHAPDWTPAWGSSVMEWEYYADYVANMNYLNAGVGIPQNPVLMHQIRGSLEVYILKRALAVSLMEFVEKFGAKVSVGEGRLENIAESYKEAQAYFIEQEYDECMDVLAGIEEDFAELSEILVELKERALLWVYIVEWLAVSGTAAICGMVLWTVMVRRRLYREVSTTRAQF